MDPRDAYEITSMLRGVVDYGTGRVIRDYGVQGPVAGKTGTTNNGADVWFVGYTPTLVAGVWFGYDTPRRSPIARPAAASPRRRGPSSTRPVARAPRKRVVAAARHGLGDHRSRERRAGDRVVSAEGTRVVQAGHGAVSALRAAHVPRITKSSPTTGP